MKKVLFVTPANPLSAASGTEQRSQLMYRALRRVADHVDVGQLVAAGQLETVSPIESGRLSTIPFSFSRNPLARYRPDAALAQCLEVAFQRPLASYDCVVVRYAAYASLLNMREIAVIADLDDLVYRCSPASRHNMEVSLKQIAKAIAWRMQRRGLRGLRGAFVVTRRDQDFLSPYVRATWLPNVVMSPPGAGEMAQSPTSQVIFVGSMWYGPNARAAEWLVREIWPLVRRRRPAATLLIAGAAPPDVRARWERHPGVSAPGFVQDLHQVYQRAGAVVVPVRDGGGSPIKLLEALAHGCPTVATSYAAAAFDPELVADRHLLVADRPEDFSAQVVQLLEEPERARKTAADGQAAVSEHFSVARFDAIVAQTLSDVC